MTIEKLPFQVIYSSSWEDEHHPSQLHIQNHQPSALGWHSQRFCTYPQTLIIRLSAGKSRIRKIQVLSHHYMISTRINLFVGNLIPQKTAYEHQVETILNQIHFNRLGFVCLDDNERTQFKARELKSIHLDVFGEFVKIVLEKCFVNTLNLYNQVGVVAINILGEVPDDFMFQSLDTEQHMDSLMLNQPSPVHGAITDDLAFDLYHDSVTAKWIRAAERAKERAILDENFNLAKSLKGLLAILHQSSEEIAKMEVAKKKAVKEEDFDHASNLKQEIEELRQALLLKISQDGFAIDSNGDIVLSTKISEETKLRPSSTTNDKPDLKFSEGNLFPTLNTSLSASVTEIRSNTPKFHSMETVNQSSIVLPAAVPPVAIESLVHVPVHAQDQHDPTAKEAEKVEASSEIKLPVVLKPLQKDTKNIIEAKENVKSGSVSPTRSPLLRKEPQKSPAKDQVKQRSPSKVTAKIDEDRPIVVKKQEINFDELDENSVPPGMSPSRNMNNRSKLKKAKHPEDDAKAPEELSEPPSPKKPPMVRKQALVKETKISVAKSKAEKGTEVASESSTSNHGKSLDSTHPFGRHPESTFEVEDLPSIIRTEMSESVHMFGDHLIACLLSKQFAAREWALTEVTKAISDATNLRRKGEDDSDVTTTIRGVYSIITKGISDTREKVVSLTLAAWNHLLEYLKETNVTYQTSSRFVETLTPLLFVKVADPNPRTKSSSLAFIVQIGHAYHDPILKMVFTPIPLSGKPPTSPKTIKARLEIATKFTAECPSPLADLDENILPFVLPLLNTPHLEAREGCHKLLVAWFERLSKARGDTKHARQVLLSKIGELGKSQFHDSLQDAFDKINPSAFNHRSEENDDEVEASNDRKVPKSRKNGHAKQAENNISRLGDLEDDTDEERISPLPGKKVLKSNVKKKESNQQSPTSMSKESSKSNSPNRHPVPGKKGALPQKTLSEVQSNDWNIDKTCIFCEKTDDGFTEEDLDHHYWNECCMLTRCPLCNHITEIAHLSEHLLRECDQKEDMKRCPKCKDVLPSSTLQAHKATCEPPAKGTQICPLCKDAIASDENAWKKHLLLNGCPMNARTLKKASTIAGNRSSPQKFASKGTSSSSPKPDTKKRSLFGFGKT